MNSTETDKRDRALWRAVFEAGRDLPAARAAFVIGAADPIAMLREALHDPGQRHAALGMLSSFPASERQKLFADLVELASVGHSYIALCREAILSLPRAWVVANIEEHAEPLFHGERPDEYEEYRRLLELYSDLDADLTRRLARRAAQSADEDIREAGTDFLAWLDTRNV